MSFLHDDDNDGHVWDEGFAMGADALGGVAKAGGAVIGGLGAVGAGLGTMGAGLGAGIAGVGAGFGAIGAAGATIGAAGSLAGGAGIPLLVGGVGLMGLGALMGAAGTGLGAASTVAGGASAVVGAAGAAGGVGIGELLQTDLAAAGAAELGDFAHDWWNAEPESQAGGEPIDLEGMRSYPPAAPRSSYLESILGGPLREGTSSIGLPPGPTSSLPLTDSSTAY